ncbi:MAG: tail fiber domain-containing protein [Hyphomicrobiaceae bacterium]
MTADADQDGAQVVLICNGTSWVNSNTTGTPVAFRVQKTADQIVTLGTATLVTWATEVFDTNNNFDLAAEVFTPTIAGKYIVTFSVACGVLSGTTSCSAMIYKNGAVYSRNWDPTSSVTQTMDTVTAIVDMNGSTDYLTAYAIVTGSGSGAVGGASANDVTFFEGALLQGGVANTAEQDPQVGALTASKWCAADAGGTLIDCTQNAPSGETYPKLASPTGTAAAPAYSFNADSNTGMFSDTADTVEFAANGIQVLELATIASGTNYLRFVPGTASADPILTNVGTDTNGLGRGLTIIAANASGPGQGGSIIMGAGAGSGAGGNGGNMNLESGSASDGNGGAMYITTRSGVGTDRSGGDIILTTGNGTGAGVSGSIGLRTNNGALVNLLLTPPGTAEDATAEFQGTSAIILPAGTDAQRPDTGVAGMVRYNSTATPNDKIEYYDAEGAAWVQLGSGGGVSFPLLANPTGTAAAPAYSFNADSNTGMFSDTADTVEFTTGGTEVLELGTVASGVNYLRITPNTTGNAPTITNVGTDTNGAGLGIRIIGKTATVLGNGGALTLQAGNGLATGAGGQVNITAGAGGVTAGGGTGAAITLTAGAGNSDKNGGAVTITSGAGGSTSTSAQSGNVTLTAADAFGIGGSVTITAGNGNTDGNIALRTDGATTRLTIQSPGATELSTAVFGGTSAITLPGGTDTQRPDAGVAGMIRYNTTATPNDKIEFYDAEGATWTQLGSGGVSFPLLANPVGSAAAPAYSFNADGDTGMFAATADKLSLATGGTERIRITSTGMSINQAADPSVALDVTGDIEYTGVIADVSDIRLKIDVAPLDGSLTKIAGLRGISFRMKGDAQARTEFGFSAQDLQKIYPELVQTAGDEMGTMTVNYIGLIAPMTEAIKELKADNDNLRTELKAANDNHMDAVNELRKEFEAYKAAHQ